MIPNIAPLRNVSAFLGLVEAVNNRSHGLPGMAVFYGPSGWGKTTAITVGGNEFRAYCVQAKYSWTQTHFMKCVLIEMGLPPVGTVASMVDAIGKQLALSDRPLIIDDAHELLRKGMIQLTRDIYESSQAPVILVGEEKLPQDLTKWENIHNRILHWEAAQACNLDDAHHLVPIYCDGIGVDEDLLRAIVDASGGSIRRVATNLARVQELARTRGMKSASLAFWGDREFLTGQPPAARNAGDLSPRGSIALAGHKKARRA